MSVVWSIPPRWRVPAQPGHHQVRCGSEEIGIGGVRDGFGAEVSAMAECLELAAPETRPRGHCLIQ